MIQHSKTVYFAAVVGTILSTSVLVSAPIKLARWLPQPWTRSQINSVETIISDMQTPHEGRPKGVPEHYDWSKKPRLGLGNRAAGFQALIAWGQVYEDTQGNRAANTRVQLRNIKAYIFSRRDWRWHLVQKSPKVEGAAYREDFVNNESRSADVRQEPDGTISVKAGEGYNYHFWPATGRVSINPQEVAGVFTTVEARLIVDNPRLRDDRENARYLLSVGGDYWRTIGAKWNQFETNGDIAIGKFKYVRSRWQAYNMTTLTPAELRRNPPPLE